MPCYRLGAYGPIVGPESWIAPGAHVVGRVMLGARSSVWFGAVIRGDDDEIVIGEGSNVQDNSVVHVDKGSPVSIASHVTIGHGCIIHGCTIGDTSLIGMGAVLLSGAQVGRCCLVGAGTVLKQGQCIEDGMLVVGVPGRIVRALTPTEMVTLQESARDYMDKARNFSHHARREGNGGVEQ